MAQTARAACDVQCIAPSGFQLPPNEIEAQDHSHAAKNQAGTDDFGCLHNSHVRQAPAEPMHAGMSPSHTFVMQ
jgi:hypothetical protein